MILWPWVSRRAFDEVSRQRDRLEAQNDKLVEQIVRMGRVEHGMTELPAEKRAPDPVPDAIRNLIAGFQSSQTQANMIAQVERLHRKGDSWEKIETFIRESLGVE